MSKQIEAYTSLQMAFHKHLIHFMAFFTITGLPILAPGYFWFIAWGIGYPINFFSGDMQEAHIIASGMTALRVIHWSTAFLFTLFIIPFTISMLMNIRTWAIWPDRWGIAAMIDGLVQMKLHYIDQEHATFGKMNIGQKASAWVMVGCTILLVISGYALMMRGLIPEELAVLARSAHALSFILLMVVLVFHVYFATMPANKAAYKAMMKTGTLDEEIVKEHHGLWYEKLKRRGIVK